MRLKNSQGVVNSDTYLGLCCLRNLGLNAEYSRLVKYCNFVLVAIQSNSEKMQVAARWFEDVWNAEDTTALQQIASPGLVMTDTSWWPEPFEGRDRVQRVIEEYLSAFKSFRYEVDEIMSSGDGIVVMAHWTARAMHLGMFLGMPASGRVEEISGVTTFRFQGNSQISSIEVFRERLSQERRGVGVLDCGI